MATLRERLNDLFPELLSSEPSKAINGTELLEKVRPRLGNKYLDSSIRQHFSDMSHDPTTAIAKVADGHGYYFRNIENLASVDAGTTVGTRPMSEPVGRETQLEEKFRSIFMRHAEVVNQLFPMHVEHTRATRREAGVNQWKFPDVVLLRWEVGKLTDQGYKLDPDLLAVKTSLGEPPFSLQSIELKVALSLSTFRENFFQCMSNSKWAHGAILAVAGSIDDKTLSDELRRLGASYDVSIVSYGLSVGVLEKLPSASEIRKMGDADFDQLAAKYILLTRISTGRERAALDWEHINDLRSLSPEFRELFKWIAFCLDKKRAYLFEDFKRIRKIESTL